ncbi:hypothetical protein [Kaarinaea lacus]
MRKPAATVLAIFTFNVATNIAGAETNNWYFGSLTHDGLLSCNGNNDLLRCDTVAIGNSFMADEIIH